MLFFKIVDNNLFIVMKLMTNNNSFIVLRDKYTMKIIGWQMISSNVQSCSKIWWLIKKVIFALQHFSLSVKLLIVIFNDLRFNKKNNKTQINNFSTLPLLYTFHEPILYFRPWYIFCQTINNIFAMKFLLCLTRKAIIQILYVQFLYLPYFPNKIKTFYFPLHQSISRFSHTSLTCINYNFHKTQQISMKITIPLSHTSSNYDVPYKLKQIKW